YHLVLHSFPTRRSSDLLLSSECDCFGKKRLNLLLFKKLFADSYAELISTCKEPLTSIFLSIYASPNVIEAFLSKSFTGIFSLTLIFTCGVPLPYFSVFPLGSVTSTGIVKYCYII